MFTLRSRHSLLEIMNDRLKAMIQFNKAPILAYLSAAGITAIEVSYSGSGDSSDGVDFEGLTECSVPIEVKRLHRAYDLDAKKWLESDALVAVPLEDALKDLLWGLVSLHGHSGWENGSGGGGTLKIDVQAGTWQLSHYDIIEEHEYSEHEC